MPEGDTLFIAAQKLGERSTYFCPECQGVT